MADRLRPHVLDMRAATWTSPTTYEVSAGARRFEEWERSYANMLGLGTAVDEALGWGLDAIAARNVDLAGQLRNGLRSIGGVEVHDKGAVTCAIVTFTVEGAAASAVSDRLREVGVNTSVTSIVSSQFDLPGRGLDQMVRASVHYFNTFEEIGRLLAIVAEFAAT